MNSVYIAGLQADYGGPIRGGLEFLAPPAAVRRGDRVFIKPNLTFPAFRKGVMTNPECLEALVVALKEHTGHITIGEADSGGYNRFGIDDVLAKTGIKGWERKYGIRVVNLSRLPSRTVKFGSGGRERAFPFPELLTDEVDLVISAAVPKIHMNTGVSLTVKNLWGCIPDPSARLRLHPCLPQALLAITRQVRRTIGLVDGRYGLNRSGPMLGEVVDLNWLLMGDSLYAADVAACRLMQVNPARIGHLRSIEAAGHRMPTPDAIAFSQDWKPFVKEPFYLKRAWTDYPGLWAFRSPALTYLAYFSPLAGPLHRILYLFRKPFYNYREPGKTEVEDDST